MASNIQSVMAATDSLVFQTYMDPEVWASLQLLCQLSYWAICLAGSSSARVWLLRGTSLSSCHPGHQVCVSDPLGRWQSLFPTRRRKSLSLSLLSLSLPGPLLFPLPPKMLNIISSKIWVFEHKRKNVVLPTVSPSGPANALGWGKRKAQATFLKEE